MTTNTTVPDCGAPTNWPGQICGLAGGHPGQHMPIPWVDPASLDPQPDA